MKTCPNCRCQAEDDALYCPVCGSGLQINPPAPIIVEEPQYIPPVKKEPPYDHTEKFTSDDIENHKLLCMLVYLLDFIGMIIALLAAKESEYTAFHIRQAMKFTILESLLAIVTVVLCWTFVVPILAAVALVVLIVLKFIAFCQVCKGKAKEPAIIRKIKFLK